MGSMDLQDSKSERRNATARRVAGMNARHNPSRRSHLPRILRDLCLDTDFHIRGTQVSSGSGPARWTPVNPVRSGRKQRQQDEARCGSVRLGRRIFLRPPSSFRKSITTIHNFNFTKLSTHSGYPYWF